MYFEVIRQVRTPGLVLIIIHHLATETGLESLEHNALVK